MKSSTIAFLLIVGAVALLIYGYNNGWLKSRIVPITTPVVTPAVSDNTQVVTNPDNVELDHSQEGFVLIPIDSSGNVVAPNRASQFIKYTTLGQDCNVQYRDRVYFVQSRNHMITPTS